MDPADLHNENEQTGSKKSPSKNTDNLDTKTSATNPNLVNGHRHPDHNDPDKTDNSPDNQNLTGSNNKPNDIPPNSNNPSTFEDVPINSDIPNQNDNQSPNQAAVPVDIPPFVENTTNTPQTDPQPTQTPDDAQLLFDDDCDRDEFTDEESASIEGVDIMDEEPEREMLVGSPMKETKVVEEEYFDNFDNAITTSLLDVTGPMSPDAPQPIIRHKYRRTMKMLLPFRREKPKNEEEMPMPYAGFFSMVTFHWMSGYMWGIYKKGIDNMPTWKCPPEEGCAVNVARFDKGWGRELEEQGPEKASIARVIQKLFAKRLIFSFLVLFFLMGISFLGPAWLLLWLLQYLTQPNIVIGYGIVLIIGLMIAEFSRSIVMAVWWFINYQMAIRVRSGLLSLMFRKVMNLRSMKDTNVGELINICTNDGQRIFDGVCMVPFLPSILVVLIFGIIYTAILIGPWALVGMLTFLLFFPIMVRLMSELLNCVKLIKMYAWERSFAKQIADVRSEERKLLEKAAYTQSAAVSSSPYIPIVSCAVTFIGHTMSGNDLTAAQAFTMLAVLNSLRFSVGILPYCIKAFAEVVVTFRRIKRILLMGDVVPEMAMVADDDNAIEVKGYSACWDAKEDDKPTSPGKAPTTPPKVTLNGAGDAPLSDEMALLNGHVRDDENAQTFGLNDVNLTIKKGHLIGVCGSIGSGKSSLLNSILGKMIKSSGSVAINGNIAYASQQAWIMNTTVRDNILFGRPYNELKYQATIEACCLQSDLKDFVAGDMSEIGERGLNLSGGQKQRISLARAVYSDADIILLDDPLASVDVHVGRHIFMECVKKALAHKTVLFVTHQLQYLKYCDRVILMKMGQISESGSHDELMKSGGDYSGLVTLYHSQNPTVAHHITNVKTDEDDAYLTLEKQLSISSRESAKLDTKAADGALTTSEESFQGEVSWKSYYLYMKAAGGALACVVLFILFTLWIGVLVYTNWFLAYWINAGNGNTTTPTTNSTSDITNSLADNPDLQYYTSVFGSLLIVMFVVSIIRGICFMKLTLKASTNLHDTILYKIMRSPMSFFDTTPTGRILNRFSKDMDEIDVFLPFRLETLLMNIFFIVASLLIITIVSPWFLIAVVPLVIIFLLLNHLFMTSVRAIKRRDNTTRSPFISHLGASINGIGTIQAYGKTESFVNKFDELLDMNSVPFLLFNLSSRWLTVRLDVMCVILTGVTGVLVVVTHEYITPAMAGLALTFAIQLTGMLQYTIRMCVETEARFTSVERIQAYVTNVDEEETTNKQQIPDQTWPKEGSIKFTDYRMKYRENLPTVLKGVNLEIQAGEKVGIVGRTGSGKSSLGVALFRLVEASSGSIEIDGVNISDILLNDLRSRLSIIPQDPVLFMGTVRYNLDPFTEHSDFDIWQSLERCHVKEKMAALPNQLETQVVENGDNFSVGERQLLCMARALLRKSKVIMLDEATAAIDTETDSLVQSTLKQAFSECTILTIAHRINTVLSCDRIMVMDNGKVVEFDSPSVLKNDENSAFKKMLDVAETRDILLE